MLQEGKCTISDRYIYSCVANLRARGYTDDFWIYEVVQFIVKPDIAFFLDVPVETAVSRVRSRESEKDRYIDMDLQYKLRDEYIKIAKENGGIIISSTEPEELTFLKVKNCLLKHVRQAGMGNLKMTALPRMSMTYDSIF
jgi:dTMP kinase